MARTNASNRTLLAIAALLIFVGAGLLVVRKTADGSDFFMHQVGAGIFRGEVIYRGGETTEHITGPERAYYGSREDRPYLYAPAPAVFAAPLAVLPASAAAAVWYTLKIGLLAATVKLLISIFTRWQLPRPTALAFLVAALPVFRFVENDFMNGQVNTVILFLVVFHIWAYVAGYRVLAGVILAAALIIKQPSLLFVVYWGMRWQFRVLAGAALGMLLWFYLVPGLFVGYPKIHDYNVQWFHSIIYSPDGDSLAQQSAGSADAQGESLLGLLGKYLTESDASHHRGETVYVNFADLPAQTIFGIHRVVAVLSVLGLWALTFVKSPDPTVRNWRMLVELALVSSLTLLLSPISHKAHFVLLFPSCLLAAYAITQANQRPKVVLWLFGIATAALLSRNDWMTERGVVPVAAMLLMAATLYLHIRPPDNLSAVEQVSTPEESGSPATVGK